MSRPTVAQSLQFTRTTTDETTRRCDVEWKDVLVTIRLIIEEIDPDTNSVLSSAPLELSDVSDIANIIDIDFSGDNAISYVYDLSNDDITKLIEKFTLNGLGSIGIGRIRRRVKVDDLPYAVHTGRELLLMLKGDKPMSFFTYRANDDSGTKEETEKAFLPYVSEGLIIKHEHKMDRRRNDGSYVKVEYLIYTLPTETWRANALVALKEAGARSGWSEGMERMEGTLLGYSDLQNDIFIETMFRGPK